MASNLRVDQITASTDGSVSIGTATFTGGLSGNITGLNVTGVITATTLNQNVTGVVTATGGFVVGTGASVYSPATNVLTLGTNSAERVRIDSSGRVGVGVTSPSYKLDVNGDVNVPTLSSYRLGTAAVISYSGGNIKFGDIGGGMTFSAAGTDRLVINAANGALQLLNSPGIDFSQIQTNAAGMTSETLDSYEEGSWTPLPVGLSGGTWSNQKGRYTKIGRLVHLKGFLQTSTPTTFSNTSANFTVGTLPFVPDNNNAGYGYVSGSMTSQSFIWLGAGNNGNNVTSGQVVPTIGQVSSTFGVQFWVFANNNVQSTVLNNAQHNRDWIVQFEVTYTTGS